MLNKLDIDLLNQHNEIVIPTLYKKLYRPVFKFCLKLLNNKQAAEDEAQKAFIALWKHKRPFDNERNIKNFLFTVAHNNCLTVIRKQILHQNWIKDIRRSDNYNDASISRAWEEAEIINDLYNGIQLLKPLQAQVTNSYLFGKTIEEIATEINMSVSTVKRYLKKSIETLKQLLCNRYLSLTILLLLATVCAVAL